MRFRDRIRTHLMKQLQLHHLLVSDSAFLAEEGLLVTGSCAHQDPILVCFSWSLLETCKQQHHCAPCWPKPTMAQRFWRPSAVPIRACVRLSCSRRRMMMSIDRWMAMVDFDIVWVFFHGRNLHSSKSFKVLLLHQPHKPRLTTITRRSKITDNQIES